MMTIAVMMRNQTEESYDILKTDEGLLYQLATMSMSRLKIEKGW